MSDTVDSLFTLEPYAYTESDRDTLLLPIIKDQLISALYNQHIKSMYTKLSVDINSIRSMEDIPAVPVTMFKSFDLKTVPDEEIVKIIRSSGTTSQIPSIIPLNKKTMHNQTKSLTRILSQILGKQRRIFLVIDHEGMNSPLTEFTARTAGIRGLSLFSKRTYYLLREVNGILKIDRNVLEEFLRSYQGESVYAFGFTYIIWSIFLKELKESEIKINLPDLIVFHSGGWKKLTEEAVSKDTFTRTVTDSLGIINGKVIDFYGMAEQTGIIFPDCPSGNKHVPIFSKVIIRDIQTMEPCCPGKTGLIEVMSVLQESYYGQAVLTEDTGYIVDFDDCPCGQKGMHFRFVKRVERAEIRGCGDTFRMTHE